MTEDEAKTKWCPFARVMVTADSDGADGGLRGPIAVGSACMAWRWKEFPVAGSQPYAFRQAGGGCGLAGTPQ